ncbi:unnamed protein product [Meganyctiphanes norvegica]|uniref:Apple domain-containing protein n=1 Tax=Meganyctiphanes norvegica TaxID=48144 RepID=A0AAV2Q307_MEGNR
MMHLVLISLLVSLGSSANSQIVGAQFSDRFTGPYEHIWSDDQCRNVGNHFGVSLSECMSFCEETRDCTAIGHEDGSGEDCVLRACEQPVPIPDWSVPPYKGYFLNSERYSGPNNNIWSDEECPWAGNYPGNSLSECMSLCDEIIDCTAINFDGPNYDCVLRACPWPIPAPQTHLTTYQGYSQGNMELNIEISGEY